MTAPFGTPDVAARFAGYPESVRDRMMDLRVLLLETAAALPQVGPVEETLKWGEPAYLTPVSRSGSTIRMDWKPRSPDTVCLYFNCQTTLIDTFRGLLGDTLRFEGNRAIVLPLTGPLPQDALRTCLAAALTYHARK